MKGQQWKDRKVFLDLYLGVSLNTETNKVMRKMLKNRIGQKLLSFVTVTLHNVRYCSILHVISPTIVEVGMIACRVNEPKIFSLQKTAALQQKITVT